MGIVFYAHRVSYQEKAYFNIITKERMVEAPPAAAPSGDQLAMKKKVKKKKKKKTKKTTGIGFVTLWMKQ